MGNFRKKLFFVSLFILVLKAPSFAQFYYYNNDYYDNDLIVEFGGSFGVMMSIADVGQKTFTPFLPANLDFKTAKTNGSIYLGVTYKSIVGARLEYTMGNVEGIDSNSNRPNIYNRNLSYRSYIHELSVIGEFYPLMLRYFDELPKWSPYIMAGIGLFSFNPQAMYQGKWVDLQPLHTEGEGFLEYPERTNYRLHSVSYPVGIGVKYELSSLFNLRLEALYRFTSTDYLDDVSTNYINDRSLFAKYLSAHDAPIALALSERFKEGQISRGGPGFHGGASADSDSYLTINLKVGLTLGRQRVR